MFRFLKTNKFVTQAKLQSQMDDALQSKAQNAPKEEAKPEKQVEKSAE